MPLLLLLSPVGFYAGGYKSLSEALDRTKIWASSYRQSFENWLGMEDRPSKTHPEVVATRHMTEDEEMNYLYEKYIKENPPKATDIQDEAKN